MMDGPYIFGLGLSRTGTTSLVEALRTLGYVTRHAQVSCRKGVHRFMLWNDEAVIQEFGQRRNERAWVGWPIHAYQTFYKYYPDAFWIYTVREIKAWVTSYQRGLWLRGEHVTRGAVSEMVENIRLFGLHFPTAERLRIGYETLNRELPAFFRTRGARLLVYDICGGDGWGPLCEFLGTDVPDHLFPHLHAQV